MGSLGRIRSFSLGKVSNGEPRRSARKCIVGVMKASIMRLV